MMMMENKKKYMLFAASALLILCFQVLYYQLTVVFIQSFADRFGGLSNNVYLMVHHTFQFLVLFVPTFIIDKTTSLDLGYHIKDCKKGLKWFLAGVAAELVISLVLGFSLCLPDVDEALFQLFFSGLGEEICYRSLPLVIFYKLSAAERAEKERFFGIDIPVVLTALFFSVGHISFRFGQPGVSFAVPQLVTAFLIGIVLAMIFKKSNSIWLCMAAHGFYNIIAITT